MHIWDDNNQTDIIEAFNSTSTKYLDDMANSIDTEAPFLDLDLSITNGIVSSKNCDKQDYCYFEILVNFPFLDVDVPRSPTYGVYISQLIRFARVCSNVDEINNRNLFLTAKILKQGFRYHKIRKHFLNSTTDTQSLLLNTTSVLKSILQQGIYQNLHCMVIFIISSKELLDKPILFIDQFKKIIKLYKKYWM